MVLPTFMVLVVDPLKHILTEAGIDWDKKVGDWTDEESNQIRSIISEEFKVEGVLKSEVQLSIKRLLDIGCYQRFATS